MSEHLDGARVEEVVNNGPRSSPEPVLDRLTDLFALSFGHLSDRHKHPPVDDQRRRRGAVIRNLGGTRTDVTALGFALAGIEQCPVGRVRGHDEE
jgi:hypothetical protein